MIILRVGAQAFCATLCIAFVSACSSSQSGYAPASRPAQFVSVISPNAPALRPTVIIKHAIPPNCCANKKTLFVSDEGANTVQMFEYPSLKYIGSLGERYLDLVQGLCNDAKGNVYVASALSESIVEYTHDGTYLRTLYDDNQEPVGCAVDPLTGNLAVSNLISTSDQPGSLAIYTKATGSPKLYTSSAFMRVYFLGYMGRTGVLYFDGLNGSYQTVYGSLKHGSMQQITISGATIEFPGTVAYSAKTKSMNIGDQDASILYQIAPTGTITKSTILSGAKDIVQGTIEGGRFIGPDYNNADVEIYAYPAGGKPKATFDTNLVQPIGSAISAPDPN